MLFDTKERLGAWAQREVGFVSLPGHTVVEMMGSDFHWVLNVGTEYVKIFVPEEIQWLKEIVVQSKGQETTVAEGTEVLIGTPASIPNGLIESLLKCLSRNTEVKKAYLSQVDYLAKDEVPHLAMVVEIDNLPHSTRDAIRDDLVTATRGFLAESQYIDIMINENGDIANEIMKRIEPFYCSTQQF